MQHQISAARAGDRHRLPAVAVALLVFLLIVSGCSSSATTPTQTGTRAPAATAPPPTTDTPVATSVAPAETAMRTSTTKRPLFDRIYLIIFENKEASSIIGDSDAPYLNELIQQHGVARNYTGITHPSQPNYLALWAGSTFNVTDNDRHHLVGKTLGDQIEAANMSWRVYAENYTTDSGCFTGSSSDGGPDGSGTYVRRHNPAMSFTNLTRDADRCSQHVTDFSHFDAAAADFSLIVPNLCHDMHDCSVEEGDDWLSKWLPEHILDTSAWNDSNSAIFITWDEGSSDEGGGGTVPLIVISHKTPSGYVSTTPYNHYSLLRTIEDAWGFSCLRDACQAPTLTEFFP